MKEIEILTAEIMQQMAEDGTPVTNEEAAEMAKMEINSHQINSIRLDFHRPFLHKQKEKRNNCSQDSYVRAS